MLPNIGPDLKPRVLCILFTRRVSSILIGRVPTYIAALSLVESFRVLKYFHALKGPIPIIGALSVATPVVLCHKEPARLKNTPY